MRSADDTERCTWLTCGCGGCLCRRKGKDKPVVRKAPSWEVLLGLRVLQGVTLAGLPAVATAYLREELHPSVHGRAFGLYIGGTALGQARR